MTVPTWKVRATIELRDADNKPITLQSESLPLAVQIKPDRDDITAPYIDLKIPLARPDDWPKVQIGMAGFSSDPVDLGQEIASKNVDRDDFRRILKLKKPIVLNLIKSASNTQPYSPTAPPLKPISSTGPG